MVSASVEFGRWFQLGKLEVYLERTGIIYPQLFDWVRYGPGDYCFLLFGRWRLYCCW